MPFASKKPLPLTHRSVKGLKADQKGVYGICTQTYWIFIGSGNIRRQLQGYLKEVGSGIRNLLPLYFVAEPHPDPELRQQELISELHPICNDASEIKLKPRQSFTGLPVALRI